jgi:S-DNA-T family DNA segregation ATPase FtsK/SpoIIIE
LTPDKFGKEIIDLVGTWPFYIQVVGDAVVRAVQAGDVSPLVDRSSLRRLVERRLIDEWTDHFKGRWAEIDTAGRSALLAQPKPPPSPQTLAPAQRNDLRDAGLLRQGEQWLADPPFFAWVTRNAASLQDRGM